MFNQIPHKKFSSYTNPNMIHFILYYNSDNSTRRLKWKRYVYMISMIYLLFCTKFLFNVKIRYFNWEFSNIK